MLLDKVIFQDERFQLRIRHNIFKTCYLRHHLVYLWSPVYLFPEIRAYPAAEAYRLSHINDVVLRVVHDVYTRLFGQFF